MNATKTIAASLVAATLGVGGLALAGVAGATPGAPAAAGITSPTVPTVEHHQALRRRVRRGIVVVSVKAIGITPKDLVAQLKTGSSIAQVATAHHVDVNTVVTALVNAGTQRIDKALANGKITPARAATLKAKLPAASLQAVNFHVSPK